MIEKYHTTLTQADLIDGDSVAVIAGIPIKLGEYQVQAGEEIAIGFGPWAGQESAIGRLYVLLMDDSSTPAVEDGLIRLSVWDPQNRPLIVLGEWRTETTASGATDRTLRIPLPENKVNLTEDQKLVLEFISDASDSIVKASCSIAIDCTRYRVRKR